MPEDGGTAIRLAGMRARITELEKPAAEVAAIGVPLTNTLFVEIKFVPVI